MEQTVSERHFSEVRPVNQQVEFHNGTVSSIGVQLHENPSHSCLHRKWTGWRRTDLSNGGYCGESLAHDKGRMPVCRDFLQGKCSYGVSCKFQHSESENLDDVSNSRMFRLDGEFTGSDPRTRTFSGEVRSRSPCRKFRSGRCFRGAACPHLHTTDTTNARPGFDLNTRLPQGGTTTSGNIDSGMHRYVRSAQVHDEARNVNDPSTSSSRRRRSRSPCRNFLRGRCYNGPSCPRLHPEDTAYVRSRYSWSTEQNQAVAETSVYPSFHQGSVGGILRTSQGHDEANKENSSMIMSFPKDPRSRSPCRNFLRGRCIHESSCRYLHHATYEGPMYGRSSQQHQEPAAASRIPVVGEGNMAITSRTPLENAEVIYRVPLCQDSRAATEQNRIWPSNDALQPDFHRQNMDITSRSWSAEKQRNNLGGDKLRVEVCLQFTKGRCNRGESCKYLHGFHEYATSIPDLGKRAHLGAGAASGNFDGAHQYGYSRMSQEHGHVKNDKMQLSEGRHARNSFLSQDSCLGETNKLHSAYGTSKPNDFDHNGGALTMDRQKYGISGREIARYSGFAEAGHDINSWNRSFKRRRSRSRSPFNPKDDYDRRRIARDEYENKFPRGRCYDVRSSRDPYCHSYQYKRPRYATSVETCSREVNKDLNLMENHGHGKVAIHEMQLDQVPDDSLESSKVTFNMKSEAECTNGSVQLSHAEQDNKDSKVATTPVDSCLQETNKNSSLVESQVHDKGVSHGMQLNNCPRSSLDSGIATVSHNIGAEPAHCAVQHSNVEQDGDVLMMSSRETDISQGGNGKVMESDTMDSCERNLNTPTETDTSALDKDSNAEVDTNTKKRKKKNKRSKLCVEPMKDEVAGPSTHGPVEGLMMSSREVDNSEGVNGTTPKVVESQSLGSCEMKFGSPMGTDASILDKDSNAEADTNLSEEAAGITDETKQSWKTSTEKRKRKKRSKLGAEPMKDEVTGPLAQGPGEGLTMSSREIDISEGGNGTTPEVVKSGSSVLDKDSHAGVDTNLSEEAITDETKQSLKSSTKKKKKKKTPKVVKSDSSVLDKDSHAEVYTNLSEAITDEKKQSLKSSTKKKEKKPEVVKSESSVLDKDDNAEVDTNLCEEAITDEMKQSLKRSTKKEKKKRSNCRVEPMKDELTGPSTQGPLSSSAGETYLSHKDSGSVPGVSDDMKSGPKIGSLENVIAIDCPDKQLEQENGAVTSGVYYGVPMQTLDSLEPAISTVRRKLLILDLNGLLADIVLNPPRTFKPDFKVSMKAVFERPFCADFLRFCFQEFAVGVWSSRAKVNVDKVTDYLFGTTLKRKLLFCWDQSHCTKTGYKTLDNQSKPLVLKELKKLWEKQIAGLPWDKGFYNETNTVLLDDSPYKALRNPPYTAVFPHPYSFMNREDKSLGPGGDLRVYLERLAAAENVQKFIQENPFGQRAITESNLSWAFYSKIVNGTKR